MSRPDGNTLAEATSPYLRQHADNPVDWYPWGDEAWAEARRRDVPVLVVCGADDQDNGSAPELARQLKHATYREIKGTHMSSVLEPALADEIIAFLAD